MKKFHKIILLGLVVFAGSLSCTNLDEHVYHNLMSANYYQKKSDVIKAVFRPFEHFFEGVQRYVPMQELPADVFMTPQMDSYGWWDGGKWSDWHTHTWQDISGLDYEWSQTEDTAVGPWPAKLYEALDGETAVSLCLWQDGAGRMYSLSAYTDGLTVSYLPEIAAEICAPLWAE